VRCAFNLPSEVWQAAWDNNNKTQMRLAIYAASNLAYFPLDQVVHFPQPMPLLLDAMPTVGEGRFPREPHPSAPWAAESSKGRKHWDKIVRASGPTADLRVGAWITKKFTWTDEDDSWIMWVLDVVGVDHVVLVVATQGIRVEELKQRFQALGTPELMDRITIMRNDAPLEQTFWHLQELHVWDLFLRWALDFDYALMCDADEYLQLFETTEPYRRVDIKTFIASNRDYLQKSGFIEFERMLVIRHKKNTKIEPLLPPFLDGLLPCDGNCTQSLLRESKASNMGMGKSLFFINGTVQPFLHFGGGYPKAKKWQTPEGHFLHIREPFQEEKRNTNISDTLQWWLAWLSERETKQKNPNK